MIILVILALALVLLVSSQDFGDNYPTKFNYAYTLCLNATAPVQYSKVMIL